VRHALGQIYLLMAARKVFWEDPYLTTLSTVVTSVYLDDVTLRDTIAYAFSGGQQSDDGTINDFKICKATKQGLEIIYTLENGHTLREGDEVVLHIDWEKRYKIMKLHFAAEIILELVNQNFGNPE
jgi:Ser-tRNA(Ala) deacylase AlaX